EGRPRRWRRPRVGERPGPPEHGRVDVRIGDGRVPRGERVRRVPALLLLLLRELRRTFGAGTPDDLRVPGAPRSPSGVLPLRVASSRGRGGGGRPGGPSWPGPEPGRSRRDGGNGRGGVRSHV